MWLKLFKKRGLICYKDKKEREKKQVKDRQKPSYQAKRTAAITGEIAQLCGIPLRNEVTVMRFLSSKNFHRAVIVSVQKS